MIYTKEKLKEIFDIAHVEFKIQQKEGEFLPVMEMLNEAKAKNIVEIGSYDGGTSYCLAHFTDRLISIDIASARFDTERINKITNYNFIHCNSQTEECDKQLKLLLKDEQVDVLFIDGDHTYEGIKDDFFIYEKYVKSGGLILFHDIVNSEMHLRLGCTVWKFWEEAKKNYQKGGFFSEIITTTEWGGIGVIKKY